MNRIFGERDRVKADFILNNQYSKLSGLTSNEVKNLAVVWCYYSGKIEGNTYTYVETEALLQDGITSPKRYEDARMLKNLYNAFITVLEQIKRENRTVEIDERTLYTLHSMLTEELLQPADRGLIRDRPVRISGTAYTPPKERDDIQWQLTEILKRQVDYPDPLEKAVFLHCNIARLQPFLDGNKRTSRLVESIVLMNHDLIPVYSSQDADLLNYRRGLLHFYETMEYSLYVDYFLNRQIERVNSISRKTDVTFDVGKNIVIKPENRKVDTGYLL
jgi:Fic family protein